LQLFIAWQDVHLERVEAVESHIDEHQVDIAVQQIVVERVAQEIDVGCILNRADPSVGAGPGGAAAPARDHTDSGARGESDSRVVIGLNLSIKDSCVPGIVRIIELDAKRAALASMKWIGCVDEEAVKADLLGAHER